MDTTKTPGVYVEEKNALPEQIIEVATAVPAFIGYTEFALNGSASLLQKPFRISSFEEFQTYFGGGPSPQFNIVDDKDSEAPDFVLNDNGKCLKRSDPQYSLYYHMRMFFENGGGCCYIVSVGNYSTAINADELTAGIAALSADLEATLVVIPEAVSLTDAAQCLSVQQAAIDHCGKMGNRMAILDVYNGDKSPQNSSGDCIASFRNGLGLNNLDFAAAYYPWLVTTAVQSSDLTFDVFENKDDLKATLFEELKVNEVSDDKCVQTQRMGYKGYIEKITDKGTEPLTKEQVAERSKLNKTLMIISPLYCQMIKKISVKLSTLPPSAAMAGVYTRTDINQGVWKAPANVSLTSVISPTVKISHDEQERLDLSSDGKSINAIRAFIGDGVRVWGAGTLAGNSPDWRYISARRTAIMLKESIRKGIEYCVFEPNDANTWMTIKRITENFLSHIWKQGGLVGSSPADAFSVRVGLGETMTPEDILEGHLHVSISVALIRPAEFIEIRLSQQMRT